jgi:hypothetical protein
MSTRRRFKNTIITVLLTGTLLLPTFRSDAHAEVLHHWQFEDSPGFLEDSVGGATLSSLNFDQVALPSEGRGGRFLGSDSGNGLNKKAAETPQRVAGLTSYETTPIDDAFTIELFTNIDVLPLDSARSVLVSQASNPYRPSLFGWALAIEEDGLRGEARGVPWNASPGELELFASDGDAIWLIPSGIFIEEQVDYYLSASFDVDADVRFYVKNLADGSVQISNIEHSLKNLRPDSRLDIGAPYPFAIMDGIIDEVRLSRGVLPIEDLLIHASSILGDVDRDGQLTAKDIDLIAEAIRKRDDASDYDMNGDGFVNRLDHDAWVKDIQGAWLGDANLDGDFNSGDLVMVFQAGTYETGEQAGWARGDWTGDQVFDSADFVAAFQDGGYELGVRAAVRAVPEPTSAALMLIGIIATSRLRRRCQAIATKT